MYSLSAIRFQVTVLGVKYYLTELTFGDLGANVFLQIYTIAKRSLE